MESIFWHSVVSAIAPIAIIAAVIAVPIMFFNGLMKDEENE